MIKFLDGVNEAIGGGLPQGSVSFLYGQSNSGKTMFLSEFVDTSIKDNKKIIVYVSDENWENKFKFLKASIRERIINNVLKDEEIETKVKIKKVDPFKTKMFDLLEIIQKDISYYEPDLIFIDDIGNFKSDPISNQRDFRILLNIIRKNNCSMISTNRSISTIGSSGANVGISSTFSYSADFIMQVEKKEQEFNLKFIKNRYGNNDESIKYKFNSNARLEICNPDLITD